MAINWWEESRGEEEDNLNCLRPELSDNFQLGHNTITRRKQEAMLIRDFSDVLMSQNAACYRTICIWALAIGIES